MSAIHAPMFSSATDPFFGQVVFLMHMDGADGSDNFVDVKGHSVTYAGNARISTDTSAFAGGSSGHLTDGITGWVNVANSSDFELHATDFTIEAFLDCNGIVGVFGDKTVALYIGPSDLSGGLYAQVLAKIGAYKDLDGTYHFYATFNKGGVETTIFASDNISLDTMYHVAVTMQGTTLRFFLNGVLKSTLVSFTPLSSYSSPKIRVFATDIAGQTTVESYAWQGYVDEIRITKGCRYTTDFTVPTAPFPNS